MEIIDTPIKELILLKPAEYRDERGVFFETYNRNDFIKAGITAEFVQDNQSVSKKNVLRGLQFQLAPMEQGKLVRVLQGEILDAAVDIRLQSKTYLKYFTVKLSAENNLMLWIPPGFAHGFLALTDGAIVSYKCTEFYDRKSEKGIRWDDKDIGIEWGTSSPILSEKDSALPYVRESGRIFW